MIEAIIRAIRLAVGEDFILIYRLSVLDLVAHGAKPDEVVQLGQGRKVVQGVFRPLDSDDA